MNRVVTSYCLLSKYIVLKVHRGNYAVEFLISKKKYISIYILFLWY